MVFLLCTTYYASNNAGLSANWEKGIQSQWDGELGRHESDVGSDNSGMVRGNDYVNDFICQEGVHGTNIIHDRYIQRVSQLSHKLFSEYTF
jgi:hypothetical protein